MIEGQGWEKANRKPACKYTYRLWFCIFLVGTSMQKVGERVHFTMFCPPSRQMKISSENVLNLTLI